MIVTDASPAYIRAAYKFGVLPLTVSVLACLPLLVELVSFAILTPPGIKKAA